MKFFFPPHHPFEGRVFQHCLPCPSSPCHHRRFATSGTTIQATTIGPPLPCPMPPAPCPAPLCHRRPAKPPSCPAPSPVAPQSPLLGPRPLVLMAPHSVPQLAWQPWCLIFTPWPCGAPRPPPPQPATLTLPPKSFYYFKILSPICYWNLVTIFTIDVYYRFSVIICHSFVGEIRW